MQRFLEFFVLFVVLLVLQGFAFARIDLYGLVNPYVYIMVILLLPMRIKGWQALFIGFAIGAVMDLMSGNCGLHTICTTWLAFVRPMVLHFTAGRDEVELGGLPISRRIGGGRFMSYVMIMSLLFAIPFFSLEAMTLVGWEFLALRIWCSSLFTAVVIYFIQLPTVFFR